MFAAGWAGDQGVNNDMYQDIDLSRFTEVITNGEVRFVYRLYYNRIAGDNVDSGFFYNASFFDRDGKGVGWFGVDPIFNNMKIADDDPNTWEVAEVSDFVPPTAVKVILRMSWNDNVEPKRPGQTFSGQYSDNIQFILIVPGSPPPPTGATLTVH